MDLSNKILLHLQEGMLLMASDDATETPQGIITREIWMLKMSGGPAYLTGIGIKCFDPDYFNARHILPLKAMELHADTPMVAFSHDVYYNTLSHHQEAFRRFSAFANLADVNVVMRLLGSRGIGYVELPVRYTMSNGHLLLVVKRQRGFAQE